MMVKLPDTSTKEGQIEASILLCRLRNWKVEDNRELEIDRTMVRYIHFSVPGRLTIDNLYTASPSIAWEFASWIAKRHKMIHGYCDPFTECRHSKYAVCMAFDDWFREIEIYRFDLRVAKRMILDKVLELAIEADLMPC